MRDKISISRVQLTHPKIRDKVKLAVEKAEAGLPVTTAVRITQGLRTVQEQNALYALGRTKTNPDGRTAKKPMGNVVTNAVGGSSYHNYGLAVDFALLFDKDGNGTYEEISWDMLKDTDHDKIKDWAEVVNAFIYYGFEWGGQWQTIKDYPHFQMTYGLSIAQLKTMQVKKDFIAGTQYLEF
jgi:peptidoglycan L-alanyl-D-glutamate endopeptidase CwlK